MGLLRGLLESGLARGRHAANESAEQQDEELPVLPVIPPDAVPRVDDGSAPGAAQVDCLTFLSELFRGMDGYLELRQITDGDVRQHFVPFPVEQLPHLKAETHDAYFGVAPRDREDGHADAVSQTGALWLDVDAKAFDGGKPEALEALHGLGALAPSIIVDSGHGFHAYWLLNEPTPISKAQMLMEALRRRTNPALDRVSDAPRLLRLPGTANHKNNESLPVFIVHWEPERRFAFEDFAGSLDLDAAGEESSERSVAPLETADILDGVPQGQRNSALFGYLCSLRARCVRPEEALILARHAADHADPPYPSDAGEESVNDMQARVWRDYPGRATALASSSRTAEEALEAARTIIETARSTRDVDVVFDGAADLAGLPAAEWGKAKYELKQILGDDLNLNDLERAVSEARAKPGAALVDGGLPVVTVGTRQLRETSDEALEALLEANQPPVLFHRGRDLVRVRQDEQGRPVVELLTDSALRGLLTRSADFYVVRHGGSHPTAPPIDIVRDISSSGDWTFPVLEGVVEVPVVRPDGSVLDTPGYDEPTRLLYVPEASFTVPPVPAKPTRRDVETAVAMVREAIGEFPFEDQSSYANAFGLLLTPIVRPVIEGPVPLAINDAPQAGTGKTLLANVAAMIATGRPAAATDAPSRDEEFDKRITALLLEGASVVVLDNLGTVLRAPSLSRALTARRWGGRILGRSAMADVPQRATWILTGNNVSVAGDLIRRCYWIRLDAKTSRPWQRTGFKHSPLLDWVTEHRGELVAALLTLTRGWICEGRPVGDVSAVLGSFESWVSVIGGILAVAEIPGFLGNLASFQDRQDTEDQKWESFLLELHGLFGGRPFTTAGVARSIETESEEGSPRLDPSYLPDELAAVWEEKRISFTRCLGQAFKKVEGTRFGDRQVHIAREGSARNAILWRMCVPTGRGTVSSHVSSSGEDESVEVSVEQELTLEV